MTLSSNFGPNKRKIGIYLNDSQNTIHTYQMQICKIQPKSNNDLQNYNGVSCALFSDVLKYFCVPFTTATTKDKMLKCAIVRFIF